MTETIISSPLGSIHLAASDQGLTHLDFTTRPVSSEPVNHPILRQAAQELDEYFAGNRREFTVPIAQSGTPFQQRVWSELARIPYGTTISYGELARRVGNPNASRAVGSANGKNHVGIIIPCHRVITAGNQLGGYASGPEHKAFLLDLEGAAYHR